MIRQGRGNRSLMVWNRRKGRAGDSAILHYSVPVLTLDLLRQLTQLSLLAHLAPGRVAEDIISSKSSSRWLRTYAHVRTLLLRTHAQHGSD